MRVRAATLAALAACGSATTQTPDAPADAAPAPGIDDVMTYRDPAGSGDLVYENGLTKVPRFEKPAVRAAILDWVTAAVTQFRARYGDAILYYAFTFDTTAENEYAATASTPPAAGRWPGTARSGTSCRPGVGPTASPARSPGLVSAHDALGGVVDVIVLDDL